MLDIYLLRLSERAKPEIRNEIARLRTNLGSVSEAMDIVADLRSIVLGGPIANGLHWLEDDLITLRWFCDQMAINARRAVCKRIPKHRRREVILAAMAAILAARQGPVLDRDMSSAMSNEALIVSEASLVDPVLFEKVIADFQAYGMSGRSSRRGPNAPPVRVPGFRDSEPNFADPPSRWCSFVVALSFGTSDNTLDAVPRLRSRKTA
ncbi:hypothetical protein MBLL_04262 [Methylobacterium bullatum]|uniref:Uncharacterized protein n=2 Tax=Methylobacterium bullatum TaxID=570505 RepID=A0A679JWZ1_9HYPH|nr:hypothetical protein MBLL_04262 [Methylobacterium bullatum]